MSNVIKPTSKSTNLLFLPLLLLWLFILPTTATASIFDPPSTDKSIEYLGMIFGGSIGGINLGLPIDSSPFLGNLFQIFNGIVLAVAVFILSYVGVISTVNTAQEGQVMGKKWSSIWIPLRSSVGLMLLAPVPGSGYSLLQVTIMWIVLNGVGAADKVWEFVLTNLSQGISATQNLEINKQETDDLIYDGERIGKRLLDNLTCLEVIKTKTDNKALEAIHAPLKPSFVNEELITSHPFPKMLGTLQFGSNDPNRPSRKNICGHIDLQVSLSHTDFIDANGNVISMSDAEKQHLTILAYQTKKHALGTMIKDIHEVAVKIAHTKINPTTNQVTLPENILNNQGLLRKAVINYQKNMSYLTKGAMMVAAHDGRSIVKNTPIIQNSERVIRQGKHFGWITAGSFYYLLSQKSEQSLLEVAKQLPILNASPMDPGANTSITLANASFNITDNEFKPYADAMNLHFLNLIDLFSPPEDHNVKKIMIPTFFKNMVENNHAIYSLPVIKSFVSFTQTSLIKLNELFLAQHTDPLISHGILGTKLMQLAEAFWAAVVVAALGSSAVAGVASFFGIGIGGIGVVLSLLMSLLPIFVTIAGIIWGVGAILGIYIPMVPYMMFVVTALGWYILVIEAIVAAPIVALGLITPAQEELGKIVPALSIIASIFLRPTLMILGLILGTKLYKAIITLVNLGFEFSFTTLQTQTGTSMFSCVAIMILYTGFIMTLVNKCYSLIYQLPDKVLRWIGGSGEQTDASGVKETQQSFEQSYQKAKEVPEGAAMSATKKVREYIQAAIDRDHAQSNEIPPINPVQQQPGAGPGPAGGPAPVGPAGPVPGGGRAPGVGPDR